MVMLWNENVNKKAYGQDSGFKENREQTDFKSGRTISYLKNSRARKTHALTFSFDDKKIIDGKTEFQWFLFWFEHTIKSGTISFYFNDVVEKNGEKEYIITDEPTWSGQRRKEVSLTFEEV